MNEPKTVRLPEPAQRFFAFMIKREQLRLRKEAGEPWPWSDDKILNTYKFTNVKREQDRTTRWMRLNWTGPNENRPAGEIIFNCALFRYFGTVEFASDVGWVRKFDPEHLIRVATRRRLCGLPIFTGAYIVPTLGHKKAKHEVVSRVILASVWKHRGQLADVAVRTRRWEEVSRHLSALPGFGGTGFMAKEVLQDVMHTPVLANAIDRNTWCPAGPGARRGLNRIFGRSVRYSVRNEDALGEMLSLHNVVQCELPSFMPALELHDIQFQLCEFDKYERTRLGEGRPKALYRRGLQAPLAS